MNLERPIAPDPYDLLPQVPGFVLHSKTIRDGESMPPELQAKGGNAAPDLSWSGFPAETESFVVTCFDPDAPTPSGFWHWMVIDIPGEITELPFNSGESDLYLPGPAVHVRNDANEPSYYGANPPAGDRPHRYIFAVHALDVPSLELDPENVSCAAVAFNALFHTIARARITVTYQNTSQ
ncbi:YbhB/YbcL family Raf kinase inhibitor-like protein [Arcanobacterium hippocoleae]|uniref:YbhB/YbcL family Raf kinase inhibitor-like protein n=1 Tax=Arcanobacterium hippocoleae TaxID=149017 RepID=UPI003340448D